MGGLFYRLSLRGEFVFCLWQGDFETFSLMKKYPKNQGKTPNEDRDRLRSHRRGQNTPRI